MYKTLMAVVACLGLAVSNPTEAAEYTLNFGTVAPEGTPWADQLRDLEKRIESESNGRIDVKLFLGGMLGSEIKMIKDVKKGKRLQGGGFSTGAVGEALNIAELTMIELPFLFRNTKEADVVLDEILFEPTKSSLAKKGLTLYSWSENGWRNFATNGGAATSPEALKKYKMRSQESPVHLNMYKTMGVVAVAKPVSEVLPALNTGIVDGFDNTPLFSLAAGWMGPVTHYTLSKHIYQPAAVVYSKSFIDSLPDDLKAVVLDNPMGEAAKARKSVRKLERALLMSIEQMGKTVVKLDASQRKAFRVAVRKKTHTKFLIDNKRVQGLYKKIKSKQKELRKK